ncbi:arginine N-succinyltransferase [Hyphococcus luteus]|uniref:Arginine N-succinyltransferase n=1 Tax=Hyphococcus luteus TaxID=2058213 RepID=A0A2S7JZ78_9PROT|nr:arginine N-succinyltransferase [Marinicaulis flavus]PQA85498.1 arginine N-succinyltransferase [Marinicaulis flavus]
MSHAFMRPVRREDFDEILALAKQSGGGMTNLPSDPDSLRKRVEFAAASFEANATAPNGEVYTMVLEKDGKVIGLSAVFSSVGLEYGFVNYRINKAVHVSKQLSKRFEQRQLVLSYDFTGASEVGSLFLSPDVRGGGYGKMLARARYLFIAQHRALIADPVCAELRGWRGPNGEQPFWEAVGHKFFEMDFEDADSANSSLGNQIINDLLPRYPIYVAMLPDAAREILGRPHDSARPALNMLLAEGFAFNHYIDVFDGGPLVDAAIDDIKTIRESGIYKVAVGDPGDAPLHLMGAGRLQSFRATRGHGKTQGDVMTISQEAASALGVKPGDEIRAVEW